MSDLATNPTPTSGDERNRALDVMRGVAVFGIFACNIWFFANPMGMMSYPEMIGTEMFQMESYKAFMMFLDGSQRGLFSIMFGAGTVLLMDRLTDKGMGMRAADIYFRRTTLLLLFGLFNAWVFLWHGDILYHYAIVSFLVFALRKAKSRNLVLIILALMAWETGKAGLKYQDRLEQQTAYEAAKVKELNGSEMTGDDKGAIRSFERLTNFEPRTKAGLAEIEKVRSGYMGSYEVRSAWNKRFESTIFYDFFFIDILIMMLSGVLLYRWGWLTNERATADYVKLAIIGLAVGLTLRYFKVNGIYSDAGYDPVEQRFWGLFHSVNRMALTLGYLGLIQLMVKVGVLQWLQCGLAAAGRMALTNYLMQSIIGAVLFLGFGFGLYGQLRGIEHYYVVLGVIIFSTLFSVWWLKHYRFGPFEWLWRSMTYGKKQPMKR